MERPRGSAAETRGTMPEGEGRQKTRRSRSDERNDREGDRSGEGEKRSATRERASERRYNRGCWTRAGRVVAVAVAAVVVGDDREMPWIRPHEEKKAAALLRGRIDREEESAGESEVEIAGGVKCM